MDVTGPANSSVYVDNAFRGKIRPGGMLRVDALAQGPHRVAADFADGTTLEGTVTLGPNPATVNIAPPPPSLLSQLRSRIAARRVLETGGAWEFYRSNSFPVGDQVAAKTMISGALEELGQACVGDYVQSTAAGPKRILLEHAVDAYDRLKTLRPDDPGIAVRRTFCQGRLEIAERRFDEAVKTLEAAAKLDPGFACTYNALGVALGRLNRGKESRQAFDTAARLTPEWALPPFQIASQYVAAGDFKRAEPFLVKAVEYNPRSVVNRWNLMHIERLLGKMGEVEKQGTELLRLDPNYAPAYLELAQAYEVSRNIAKAVEAYDIYTLLAPNYAGTDGVRLHADRLRGK